MNKKLLLLLAFCALLSANEGFAQGTLIHYWHFNNFADSLHTDNTSADGGIRGIKADFSIHDTNVAQIRYSKVAGTATSYSTYIDTFTAPAGDHDTFNARMSVPAGWALRVRNPSDAMQLLFYVPTVHYKNILLKYAVERSNAAGMTGQQFDYSVDSAVTWRTTGLTTTTYTVRDTFGLVGISFGSDTDVNNNAKLVFRVRFVGSNTGTSGNNRFDNVTVDGDSIIATTIPNEVHAVTNLAPYTLYPNPAVNSLEIIGAAPGTKSVVVYNATGQKVIDVRKSGTQFTLNIAQLVSGNYFVSIKEDAQDAVTTVRFTKD
jgi:hypothetical protein